MNPKSHFFRMVSEKNLRGASEEAQAGDCNGSKCLHPLAHEPLFCMGSGLVHHLYLYVLPSDIPGGGGFDFC